MKKLLTILGSIGLTTTASASVLACSEMGPENKPPKKDYWVREVFENEGLGLPKEKPSEIANLELFFSKFLEIKLKNDITFNKQLKVKIIELGYETVDEWRKNDENSYNDWINHNLSLNLSKFSNLIYEFIYGFLKTNDEESKDYFRKELANQKELAKSNSLFANSKSVNLLLLEWIDWTWTSSFFKH